MNETPAWLQTCNRKNADQIAMHEASYGAKLGVLKTQPTQKQLDKDFEDRKAKGELFTQQKD